MRVYSALPRTPLLVSPPPSARPAVDRFAEKVALTESGCLEWQACRNPRGYGKFFIQKVAGRVVIASAHRWSYVWHHGPMPDDLVVDHLCRNTSCVHPEHLEAVTQRENTLRRPPEMAAKGGLAQRQTHCNEGHPLADQNLYIQPKTGKRFCKQCRNDRMRAWRAKQKRAA